MNQREIKNSGFDALDTDNGDVAALLNSLPRVEAPNNFEFGVRARIAKGAVSPASYAPFWKVAAPSALILLVTAFAFFYPWSPNPIDTAAGPDSTAPEVTRVQAAAPSFSEPAAASQSSAQAAKPTEGQLVASSRERRAEVHTARRTPHVVAPNRGEGSFDTDIRPAPVITAPGFESTLPGNRSSNSNTIDARRPVKEVFEMLGIGADFVEGGWKVRSVTENSVASRAKIQAGDIVEAIDGQQLKGTSVPSGSSKVIAVRRGGKTINLELK
ncbi:MAG TPA: PDZ domain-containing protein [Pyrinomonadaceae bacterium]|nr:PDZ domain-containing protein [Pyrinomonadaceae bacterium]